MIETDKKTSEILPPVAGHLEKAPVYALPADATEDDARKMAVKVMYDSVTFPWAPDKTVELIYPQGEKVHRHTFSPDGCYAGMPYCGAHIGIHQALEYYDFSNGRMCGLDYENISPMFGSTCASTATWALASVLRSNKATFTNYVTPAFGFQAIGGLRLPEDLVKWVNGEKDTKHLVEATDEETLYRAYVEMKPADLLLTTGSDKIGNHCMMCYAPCEVVYRADGSIDPEESFATIIDQWAKEYPLEIDGTEYQVRGRVGKRYRFAKLREKHFIPMRAEEFADWKGYVKGCSGLDRNAGSLEDLSKARVISNYRLAALEFTVTDGQDREVFRKYMRTVTGDYPSGKDREYPAEAAVPDRNELMPFLTGGQTYTARLKSLIATGEWFTVSEFPMTDQNG